MTTPSTGDARVEERVVRAVARAVHARRLDPVDGQYWFHEDPDKCQLSEQVARSAIEAYRNATRENV